MKSEAAFHRCILECRKEIERACEYMREHFTERIYLEQICRHAGLSKSTLLRAFTKEKVITPYRYLETIFINEAKKLLSEGILPVEAAIRTAAALDIRSSLPHAGLQYFISRAGGISALFHYMESWVSVMGMVLAVAELFLSEYNGKKNSRRRNTPKNRRIENGFTE